MNRLDRALAILLLLRGGRMLSAADLARRLEVSPRTIYRDVETLGAVGVPVYAEMGRAGGFRLAEGYFLPPVMLAEGEAISLLLGLAALRRLRAAPFATDVELAERKLLAAVPEHLRASLARTRQIVGFEDIAGDIFHPEPSPPQPGAPNGAQREPEGQIVETFLRAILDGRAVEIEYHSPYAGAIGQAIVAPRGLLWDRDRWYLAGQRTADDRVRLWRADRVIAIRARGSPSHDPRAFDIGELAGHRWLREAMERWRANAPVRIRITRAQAERLRQDWYYRHAGYADLGDGQVLLSFGEDDRAIVFELLRWLGPGAELIEPDEWREAFRAELAQMMTSY